MRLKHRVRVVQELEDTSERNAIRCVIGDGFFSKTELEVRNCFSTVLRQISSFRLDFQELLGLVREEIISQKKTVPDKSDPFLQPYEAYKVDFEYFKVFFATFSPWGGGEFSEALAARIFSVSVSYLFINVIFFHYLCKYSFQTLKIDST